MMEFDSMADLAHHLMQETVGGLTQVKKGLEAAAVLLEETAKEEIGHYQEAIGPFDSWAPLAESTEARKAAKGYPPDSPLLATGAMRDSITHETESWEATVGSTDPKMVYHEFGTARIPPRPVLGTALYKKLAKVQKLIGNAAVSGFVGGDPIHPSLGYDVEGQPE
jgi:phage gpG-like protein